MDSGCRLAAFAGMTEFLHAGMTEATFAGITERPVGILGVHFGRTRAAGCLSREASYGGATLAKGVQGAKPPARVGSGAGPWRGGNICRGPWPSPAVAPATPQRGAGQSPALNAFILNFRLRPFSPAPPRRPSAWVQGSALVINEDFCSVARRERFLWRGILKIFRALKNAKSGREQKDH
jgi:hypothetical protein